MQMIYNKTVNITKENFMADRAHPKTHVEDQDIDGLRKQPLSPRNEGIDPLTESDTMLPREDTKAAVADAPKSKSTGSKTSSR